MSVAAASRERLLALLIERSFKKQKVVLSSGKESDFYIDCKKTVLTAEGHFLVGHLFFEAIRKHAPEAAGVGGITMGADPLASAVSLVSHVEGHPLHIGGGRQFPFGHVKLTIAHHGSTGPDGEALGNPAGVVIAMGGKKVYHAGDTALFLDMKLIAEMNGPFDAALLPIGDNFTMGIVDAAI